MTTNKTVKRRNMSKDKKNNKKKHTSTTRRHRHKKNRKHMHKSSHYLWKDYAYESNGVINNTTNNTTNIDKPVNIVNGLRDYLALKNKEKIHK